MNSKLEFYLIELYHMRMPCFLQNINLSSNSFDIAAVLNFLLFQYFNSHWLVCNRVGAETHFAKSPLPERLA